jgi:cytochrome c-type biogenesis protein CcmE
LTALVDPARKRKIRLIVALSAAVLLAVALIYTSFSASTEAKQPSDILSASPDQSYQMTGVVVPDSIHHRGSQLNFRVADRDNSKASIPVRYSGEVPDPFADGREVIVTGKVEDGTFMAQRDSLITKCPSKFQTQAQQDPQHVIITK